MSSALAIVSKAVFEKQANGAAPGAVLALDHYGSTHAALAGLADGGALFLVTVRPPDEQLWLVAVLEKPKLGKTGWTAAANRVPISDISKLKGKLVFASGTGIQAKPGALGMSLQTPRPLTDADVALLRAATGKPAKTSRVVAPATGVKVAKVTKVTKPVSAPVAGPDSSAHLAALQAAFAAKDGAAALTAALAWWRVQRAPALADLIDEISQHVSSAPVPSQIDFARVAAAKNPLDLGRLLPAVTDLPVGFLPAAGELLAAYPDDPRIATAFASWTMVPITTSTSKTAFWATMHKMVERIGDVRIVPALEKRLAAKKPTSEWWDRYYNRLDRTIRKLQSPPPAIDARPLAKLRVKTLSQIGSGKAIVATAPTAPTLTGPLLAQAATHLAAGRIAPAIDAMVARWRETRVRALADLIDRASRLLPSHDRPLAHDGDAQAAWIAVCETDPGPNLPLLLDHLRAIRGSAPVRMAMLAGLPDDPRTSLYLAQICEGGAGRDDMQFSNTLFETLARHRDVRTCGPVRTIFNDFASTYRYVSRPAKRFMGKLALAPEKFFDAWPLALDAADQALFARLAAQVDAAVTKAEARERTLLAAIAADWRSDGPREVYADHLMEREHPRGELIMLELKSRRTAEEDARLAVVRAIPNLFGALGHAIDDEDSARERGLYRAIKLRYDANTLHWRALAASPLAALLEEIEIDGELPTAEDFLAFVAAASSLKKIKGISRGGIELRDPDHAKHWKVVGTGQSQHVVRL